MITDYVTRQNVEEPAITLRTAHTGLGWSCWKDLQGVWSYRWGHGQKTNSSRANTKLPERVYTRCADSLTSEILKKYLIVIVISINSIAMKNPKLI